MKLCRWLNIPIFSTLFFLTNVSASAGLFGRPDFFEKGYEQFEAEIQRFQQEENVTKPIMNLDETSWSRVIIEEAGFTVKMPPGTITKEVKIVEAPKGDLKFNILASHPQSSRYVIAYSEKVAPERFSNAKEVLEKTQETIIKNNVGLSKVAEKNFTFEKYLGKQFQLKNQNETITFRLLLVGQRLYVLAVNQQNDTRSIKAINTFFESFELIN